MLGDYDQEERAEDYVSEYKLLLKQTAKIEEKIAEAHKSFKLVQFTFPNFLSIIPRKIKFLYCSLFLFSGYFEKSIFVVCCCRCFF